MKLSEIRVDAARLEEGDWVGDLPEMGGLRLKVRGINNEKYRKAQQRMIEALPRSKKPGGRIDPKAQDEITSKCLLETVLIDWDGLEGDDGKPLAYDRAMAERLLTEPDYRRFREAVIMAAAQVGDRAVEAEKAVEGNS